MHVSLEKKRSFFQSFQKTEERKRKEDIIDLFFSDVEEYGKTSWIIMTEIDVTDDNYSLDSTNVEEVAEGCIEYLNQPPKRKRKTKKKIKLPYGSLKLYKASVREDDQGAYIFAHLIIDERKNKNFWSEGPIYHGTKRRKRATSQK